ncbi:hypothetical protein HXZ72_14500, partial [Acinetobacter indicus]|nr:hypothetical protein [Acinetobacter indicus]MDM1322620.1 hypothetical protein [Acinetobacter indicus]MDM1334352.1 hypothetical protein [Acinetobacter indicus]
IENIKNKRIEDDWDYLKSDREVQLELTPSLISRNAFTSFDSSWYFVELIEGEFEDIGGEDVDTFATPDLKVIGGELCPRTGYWILSNDKGKRLYFTKGTVMNKSSKDWGEEYWVYDGEE